MTEWYGGRSIFITGGTGYMGKVLVEKLIRDCDDIKFIYILCRPKRGFSPAARIEQIRKLPVEYRGHYLPLLTARAVYVRSMFASVS